MLSVITQAILFVVVYGLYEVSIFLVRRVEQKREAKFEAEGLDEDEADIEFDSDLDDGQGSDKND